MNSKIKQAGLKPDIKTGEEKTDDSLDQKGFHIPYIPPDPDSSADEEVAQEYLELLDSLRQILQKRREAAPPTSNWERLRTWVLRLRTRVLGLRTWVLHPTIIFLLFAACLYWYIKLMFEDR